MHLQQQSLSFLRIAQQHTYSAVQTLCGVTVLIEKVMTGYWMQQPDWHVLLLLNICSELLQQAPSSCSIDMVSSEFVT